MASLTSLILPSQPPASTQVEFKAYQAINMDELLLLALPTGFTHTLDDDKIVTSLSGGDVRLFGEFVYSKPIDLPIDGLLLRWQETRGGAVQFEVKNLSVLIVEVLNLAGSDNAGLMSTLFAGGDKFTGSAFDDLFRGFGGEDTIDGAAGNDYLRGDDGDDSLRGGTGSDDLNGNQGNDTLNAGDGNDWVCGGQNDDRLLGEAGDDLILGNLGWDSLAGGAGNDTLRGGQDNDVLEGGDGDDWLSGDRGFDILYGGRGADTFYFFPGAGVDRIHDFNAAEGDRLLLQLGTLYTVEQVGADVLLRSGDTDQVVLVGVQLSSLPAGWVFEG